MSNLHIVMNEFVYGSRILKQVTSLCKRGIFNSVYVAALHKEGLRENEVVDDKIFVRRFHLMSRWLPKSFLFQAIKYFEFLFLVVWSCRKKNIEVVNVHSVSVLPIGVLIKYLYGARLIYDAHELETEVDYLLGFRKVLVKWLERICIRFIDGMFVVSESIADQYVMHYRIERPVVVFNCPRYREVSRSNIFRESFGIDDNVKILLYQGVLAPGRGVELMLQSYESLASENIAIVFMGYGPLETMIKEFSVRNKGVYLQPAVPPHKVLDYTSSADIGVSVNEITCLSYYYSMPNKLFDYMMAGLPVLIANNKEMAEFVLSNQVGVVMEDYAIDSMLGAVKKLLLSDLEQMRLNALNVAKKFNWEAQENKMIEKYGEILKL